MKNRLDALLANPRIIALSIAIIIVAGLGALQNLPRIEDPHMTNRHATVVAYFPGANAERVEALVLEPLEKALREIPEISHLDSTAKAGVGSIVIELEDAVKGREAEILWAEARDKLTQTRSLLPKGVSEPILDDDRFYAYTWIGALTWEGDGANLDELARHAKELATRLTNMQGTAAVDIVGQPEQEVRVDIDPVKLASLGLDIHAVSRMIAEADAKVDAGELHNDNHRMALEVSGAFNRLDDIEHLPIVTDTADATSLQLMDIAKVYREEKSPANHYAFVDGQRSIVVAVRMLHEVRGDIWTRHVQELVSNFKAALPSEVKLKEIFVQEKYNTKRLSELMGSILQGFALILVVLFLTMGWRSAILVSVALPLITLFSLACMRLVDMPIHQMSVTGLIVALGIMVDNAIVVVDTVMRYRREGLPAHKAVSETFSHLWMPLLGSTLTTILAFMPLILMPGSSGEFVSGISVAVIGSLVGAFLISLFIIGPLAGKWLSGKQSSGLRIPFVNFLFRKSLELSLALPRLSIVLIMALCVYGFVRAGALPEQFFPPSDRDTLNLEVYLPTSSSIEATLQAMQRITRELDKEESIVAQNWFVGRSTPSYYYNLHQGHDGAAYYAQAMIKTPDFVAANKLIGRLQRKLDTEFPEYQIILRRLEQGVPANAPVELRLLGADVEQLKQVGDEIRRIALETKDVLNVRSSLSEVVPKIWLEIDPVKARASGASPTELSAKLQADLSGARQGSLVEATEQLPVRVRVDGIGAVAMDELELLPISFQQGPRPLMAIATPSLKPVQAQITRRDGAHVNSIGVFIRDGVLPSVVLDRIKAQLKEQSISMPSGVTMEIGGDSKNRDDSLNRLLSSAALLAVLMVVTVVMSFNSFRFSIVIFIVAAQAAGLGMLSLALSGFPFGFTSIIGLMGLVGLAVNAAIIILSELKADTRAMAADKAAIVASVSECTRHITSTTITTVVGLLPLILGGGGFWPPFAIVLAGGTALATIVSLYFVPAIFLVLRKPYLLSLLRGRNDVKAHEKGTVQEEDPYERLLAKDDKLMANR